MTIEHSTITEADLHENKGASTATDDFVATVTTGATVWKKLTTANLDTTSIFTTNKFYGFVTIPDVSTATKYYFYIPFAGTLTHVGSVIDGTIATANATITVKNNAGSSAGTLTIAYSGSAAGDIDTLTPASNNTFTAGQFLTIETDGASTNTVPIHFTLTFTVTG